MLISTDARRRSLGLFFLLLAVVMVIWGQTVLKPHLEQLGYLLYWLACIFCLLVAVAMALLDMWVMGRRNRRQQEELYQRTMMEIKLKLDTARRDEKIGDQSQPGAS